MSNVFDFSSINVTHCHPADASSIQSYGNTFQRRLGFAQYHFDNFMDGFSMTVADRNPFGIGSETSDRARQIYEAEIDGFLRNLHCLVDSLPYLVWLLYPEHRGKTKEHAVDWKFIAEPSFGDTAWFSQAKDLSESAEFISLKTYCNTSKHRLLPRIKRSLALKSGAVTVEIELREKGSEQPTFIDAKEFLVQCHDRLVPKALAFLEKLSLSTNTLKH